MRASLVRAEPTRATRVRDARRAPTEAPRPQSTAVRRGRRAPGGGEKVRRLAQTGCSRLASQRQQETEEDDMHAKHRFFSLAVAVAAVLAAVHTVVAQTPALSKPSDFGMRFEFGRCTTDVLDTFQGVFMRDMGSPNAPVVSSAVNVPAEALAAAWRAITAAQFFDYQSNFRVTGNSVFAPAIHYRLAARGASQS
jgi:hypothetical protein